jgi:hypothetical protein
MKAAVSSSQQAQRHAILGILVYTLGFCSFLTRRSACYAPLGVRGSGRAVQAHAADTTADERCMQLHALMLRKAFCDAWIVLIRG